jgi:dGTPase
MPDLAAYAISVAVSRGRRIPEDAPESRNEFQRDRDRIIHSTAFRRLEYKTQVFVNHEGDHFRTRLTHSLEVAQIARSIARTLHLNEDLTEAVALAHDLGHTPFGHAGQDALNECMRSHGGFEHNLQSLRVVDVLEQRYAAFDGLNLCFETREGILKHCSIKQAERLGEVGERFIRKRRPSLEAQVANLADEIAYNNHDVDDGLRSGLLSLDQLCSVAIFRRQLEGVRERFSGLAERRLIYETIRRMVNVLVTDLTHQSQANIARTSPGSVDQVRDLPALVDFSSDMRSAQQELKSFLLHNLYRHYKVNRAGAKARRIVQELFEAFQHEPRLLPPDFQEQFQRDGLRAIADYVAGMTDRYAIREYRRLFAVEES